MKIKARFFLVLLSALLLFGVPVGAKGLSAKDIGKAIEKAIPLEFGYVDNTIYYVQNYFSDLNGVDDCYIVTSAESTNFNEFGIFHLKNRSDVKNAKRVLLSYLETKKSEFEKGVIYDIDEYPKFQNASVFSLENYVCYTILTPKDVKKATSAVKGLFIH